MPWSLVPSYGLSFLPQYRTQLDRGVIVVLTLTLLVFIFAHARNPNTGLAATDHLRRKSISPVFRRSSRLTRTDCSLLLTGPRAQSQHRHSDRPAVAYRAAAHQDEPGEGHGRAADPPGHHVCDPQGGGLYPQHPALPQATASHRGTQG